MKVVTKQGCLDELKHLHRTFQYLLIRNRSKEANIVYDKILVLNWLLDEIREAEVRDGKETECP